MRTAILPIPPYSSARKPSLHLRTGRCALGLSMWGLGGTHGGADTHRVLNQGTVASLALEARSEPSTPVFTIVFNRFMLVVSFSYSSELAHRGRNAHPHLGLGRNALPVFLCIYFSVDVKSLQDSICMEIIGPNSPIILHNFYFGLYKGKE